MTNRQPWCILWFSAGILISSVGYAYLDHLRNSERNANVKRLVAECDNVLQLSTNLSKQQEKILELSDTVLAYSKRLEEKR